MSDGELLTALLALNLETERERLKLTRGQHHPAEGQAERPAFSELGQFVNDNGSLSKHL